MSKVRLKESKCTIAKRGGCCSRAQQWCGSAGRAPSLTELPAAKAKGDPQWVSNVLVVWSEANEQLSMGNNLFPQGIKRGKGKEFEYSNGQCLPRLKKYLCTALFFYCL